MISFASTGLIWHAPPMPFRRSVSSLLLVALSGVAGWLGARRAHDGLLPSSPRSAAKGGPSSNATLQTQPAIIPSSPEGKWMARVRSASPADLAALFDEIETVFPDHPGTEARSAAQEWLLGVWISRDPDSAISFVANRDDYDLSGCFGGVFGRVAPEKAAAALKGLMAGNYHFLTDCLDSLAENDPQEFLSVYPDDRDQSLSAKYVRALRNLAERDPGAAAAAWSRRGMKPARAGEALHAVISQWYASDPQAARQWAEALEDPATRLISQHAWLGALAKKDPRAALQELASMDLGELRERDARTEIISSLARQDLPAAVTQIKEIMEGLPDKTGENGYLLQYAVAETANARLPDDPLSLRQEIEKLKAAVHGDLDAGMKPRVEAAILRQKMRGWDGAQCLQAAAEINVGEIDADLASIVRQLVGKAVEANPERVLAAMDTEPRDSLRVFSLEAFNLIAKDHPALAAKAAAAIPERVWTFTQGTAMAESPEQFTDLVTALPLTPETAHARAGFAQSWTEKDPEAASGWVASLPQGEAADACAQGVAESWSAFDDAAAFTWVEELPQGSTRDHAITGLVRTIGKREPELAWKWAASIADPGLAVDALLDVGLRWGADATPEFHSDVLSAVDRADRPSEFREGVLRVLKSISETPPP